MNTIVIYEIPDHKCHDCGSSGSCKELHDTGMMEVWWIHCDSCLAIYGGDITNMETSLEGYAILEEFIKALRNNTNLEIILWNKE